MADGDLTPRVEAIEQRLDALETALGTSEWVTVTEAAQQLGVDRKTLYRRGLVVPRRGVNRRHLPQENQP